MRGISKIGCRGALAGACIGWAALLGASAQAADGAAERLSEAVKIQTISTQDAADFDAAPFFAFHDFLAQNFPKTHAALEREIVAEYSLLYTWKGSDASLEPILLTSHIDTVPVIPESLSRWTQPPFSGAIVDGFVWGRGTLDNKFGVMATLEAVEALVAEGFEPTRTVYLAFGHDEEIGGNAGAEGITQLLESRNVRLWFSLDEGMAILDSMAGLEGRLASIGVAEKGFVSLEVTARAPGGHSSMPSRDSAIGKLSAAIVRIEASPMPLRLGGMSGEMLDAIGEHSSGFNGFALRNRWLFGPLVTSALSERPETNAMIRTTTAVTIVRGGVKENVLPSKASAIVNFRLHPQDTVEGVLEHTRNAVDDPEIEVTVVRGSEASEVSSSSGEAWDALCAAIEAVYPGTPTAPALVLGGTDSKHYARVAGDSYRFAPMILGPNDARRVHGIDERISIETYERMPAFYSALIRGAAGPR